MKRAALSVSNDQLPVLLQPQRYWAPSDPPFVLGRRREPWGILPSQRPGRLARGRSTRCAPGRRHDRRRQPPVPPLGRGDDGDAEKKRKETQMAPPAREPRVGVGVVCPAPASPSTTPSLVVPAAPLSRVSPAASSHAASRAAHSTRPSHYSNRRPRQQCPSHALDPALPRPRRTCRSLPPRR